MGFAVSTRPGTAGDRTGTVYVLADAAGTARAEVWPFAGFNCLRWQVRTPDGRLGDVLYTAPDWETNPVPTRSGHPVLFPFPNRIRGGRFDFGGKTYQLPLLDSTKQNAIHGFAPRNPWRVTDSGGGPDAAFVTGQLHLSGDLPADAPLWPADFVLSLTYRLSADSLRVTAVVENPGPGPLPFGLGYHPYFRIPTAPDATADEMMLFSAANTLWETEGGLPTGKKLPLPAEFDFRTPKPIGPTVLDNLFGDVPANGPGPREIAALSHPSAVGRLSIRADATFGESVLFTPQHRKAVAIEPYTCASDAANLQSRGVAAGWREMLAGGRIEAVVEYQWEATR